MRLTKRQKYSAKEEYEDSSYKEYFIIDQVIDGLLCGIIHGALFVSLLVIEIVLLGVVT